MQTILKPNFSFYNNIDQKAGCLNFLFNYSIYILTVNTICILGNMGTFRSEEHSLWHLWMLTETGYETIKSHDLLSLWGVDGGGGFVNLERFVEGVVWGWVIKTKQVQTRGNGSSKFWSFCDNVITEFRWHKWSLVRKHTWANIK